MPPSPPQVPTQPPPQQWAPRGTPGPLNTPSWPVPSQNTQFTTQNWVSGPGTSQPGMYLGPYYPPPSQNSQGGYTQVPGTQYSQHY